MQAYSNGHPVSCDGPRLVIDGGGNGTIMGVIVRRGPARAVGYAACGTRQAGFALRIAGLGIGALMLRHGLTRRRALGHRTGARALRIRAGVGRGAGFDAEGHPLARTACPNGCAAARRGRGRAARGRRGRIRRRRCGTYTRARCRVAGILTQHLATRPIIRPHGLTGRVRARRLRPVIRAGAGGSGRRRCATAGAPGRIAGVRPADRRSARIVALKLARVTARGAVLKLLGYGTVRGADVGTPARAAPRVHRRAALVGGIIAATRRLRPTVLDRIRVAGGAAGAAASTRSRPAIAVGDGTLVQVGAGIMLHRVLVLIGVDAVRPRLAAG